MQNINDIPSEEALNDQQLLEKQYKMYLFLAEQFQRNLQAFQQYLPDIYETFKEYNFSAGQKFLCLDNEIPNLFLTKENHFFYQAENPVEFCQQQVDTCLQNVYTSIPSSSKDSSNRFGQIHHRYLHEIEELASQTANTSDTHVMPESYPLAIVVGCGLGYHIGYLYEKVNLANLIIIEPDKDLFFASLHTFDWANLLSFIAQENRGFSLLVGQDEKEVYLSLEHYFEAHGNMLASFRFGLQHYTSPETAKMTALLQQHFDTFASTLGFLDDHFFSLSHAMYSATHHVHYKRQDRLLPDSLTSLPLCIVANGPSLSQDLDFLRQVQDHVLIMACGSAIETLYNAGIQPTFYAVTERLNIVAEHLSLIPDTSFFKKIILVSTDVVHPNVVKLFKHQCIFSKADEAPYLFCLRYLSKEFKAISPICLTTPFAANMGLSSALQFGFHNIFLFGVDNGTTRSNKLLHPEESLFYQKEDMKKAYENYDLRLTREGNFGDEVQTNYFYTISATYMAKALSFAPYDTTVTNWSHGLKIQGTKAQHSSELSYLKNGDLIDKNKVISVFDTLLTFTVDSLTEAKVKELLNPKTFNTAVETIKQQLQEAKKSNSRFIITFIFQSICEYINKIRYSHDGYIAEMLSGSMNTYFIQILLSLYRNENKEQALHIAHQQIERILYFLEDGQKIYDLVPHFYAELHYKYFDGKVGFDHPNSKAPDFTPEPPCVSQADRDRYPVRTFVKRTN